MTVASAELTSASFSWHGHSAFRTVSEKLSHLVFILIEICRLRNALEDAMTGRPDVHGRTGQLYPTRDTMDGLANFQAFVDQFGQHSPTGGVLMSANITRKDALSTPKGRLLRPATVRRYLGKGVRFRSMDTHLRCNVCISLKDVIAKSSGVEKERFIHLNNLHNRHVL